MNCLVCDQATKEVTTPEETGLIIVNIRVMWCSNCKTHYETSDQWKYNDEQFRMAGGKLI
jgi:hypothetical protein